MQIEELETKVKALREGSVLVTPEERREVQAAYDHKLGLWRRRKKIYQELWGMITESMTENLKDLKVLRLSFSALDNPVYVNVYTTAIENTWVVFKFYYVQQYHKLNLIFLLQTLTFQTF